MLLLFNAITSDFSSLCSSELFSVSKDKAVHIMDVEAGKLVTRIPKAHTYLIFLSIFIKPFLKKNVFILVVLVKLLKC